jgi:hypothetical protein
MGFWNPRRQQALIMFFTPTLVFLGRSCWKILLFCSVALLSALLSGHPSQQGLGGIYSAPVMVMMTVAMIEILSTELKFLRLRSGLLVLIVIAVHFYNGFLPGGGKSSEIYTVLNPAGCFAITASKHIPREGILLTEIPLAGFCGNRKDVVAGSHYRADVYAYDVVFCRISMLRRLLEGGVWEDLQNGEIGIRYTDGMHIIAERGYPATYNQAFAEKYPFREIWVQETPAHGGVDIYSRQIGPYRYWEGDGSRGPINLSFGGHRDLQPGLYKAVMEYKAEMPERDVRNSWGRFSVHKMNAAKAIVEVEIPEYVTGSLWNQLEVPFECKQATSAEFRITGCDAPLALRRLWILPRKGE